MVFRNNLYCIDAVQRFEWGVSYQLHLNGEHVIYKAHFPGEPITPGVCLLQMGAELLSDSVGSDLECEQFKNVKFVSVLRPDGAPVYVDVQDIRIEEGLVKARIDFRKSDVPVAKLSLICRTIVK